MEPHTPHDWQAEYRRIWHTVLNEKERRQWDKLSEAKKQEKVAQVLAFERRMLDLHEENTRNRRQVEKIGEDLARLTAELNQAVDEVEKAAQKTKSVEKWVRKAKKPPGA